MTAHVPRLVFAMWLVASGIVGAPTPCAADSPVTLRGDVEIKRPAVRLSDLFVGVPSEIDRDVAQAPALCKQATYDAKVLRILSEKYRLEWLSPNDGDHVVVTVACTKISTDSLREAVVAKVRESGVKDDVDVAFDNHALEIVLPADQAADFTLENFAYDRTARRFRTEFHANTLQPFTVAGRITIKRQVPVLGRRLESGTIIGNADIDWLSVPEERLNASIILDASHLVGSELRRDMAEEQMITTHDVAPPRMVTRGGLITIKAETPLMLVTVQGKALQDGAKGETVRVMNTQSNRMIEGVVESAGVVRIESTQKFASVEAGGVP